MRTTPFLFLFVVVFTLLLGLRFGLASIAGTISRATVETAAAEAVMALPPKPDGLTLRPAGAGGEGGAALLDEAACLRLAVAVRDVCWQALARQDAAIDVDHALGWCTRITDGELALECRADVAESVAGRDRAGAEGICEGIDAVKWRGQCQFGIGLALAETDPAYAVGRCAHAEAFRDFCRHDVIGEIALVDPEFPVAFCAREEGDELTRKTCWHGMGKYLARRSLDEAAAACLRATPAWRGSCFHGAGWGAAERDPDAALAGCDRQREFADNCRQGVAHELKRADPARAVALCEAIATETIRSRCLAFVRR